MNGVIGERERIAAMRVLSKAGFQGEARQLLVGSPARVLRRSHGRELHWKPQHQEYQDLAVRCPNGVI